MALSSPMHYSDSPIRYYLSEVDSKCILKAAGVRIALESVVALQKMSNIVFRKLHPHGELAVVRVKEEGSKK